MCQKTKLISSRLFTPNHQILIYTLSEVWEINDLRDLKRIIEIDLQYGQRRNLAPILVSNAKTTFSIEFRALDVYHIFKEFKVILTGVDVYTIGGRPGSMANIMISILSNRLGFRLIQRDSLSQVADNLIGDGVITNNHAFPDS